MPCRAWGPTARWHGPSSRRKTSDFSSTTDSTWWELAASFQRNQYTGTIERGASTLSQQLARLVAIGGERTPTPTRKLRELLYAVEMEQTLGKARILRLYLDHAPWGPGLCGADAAARHYFGLRGQELDAGQAVWLAAMLHNPATSTWPAMNGTVHP